MESDHVPLEIESEGLVNKKVKEKAMKEIKRSLYTRGLRSITRNAKNEHTHKQRKTVFLTQGCNSIFIGQNIRQIGS